MLKHCWERPELLRVRLRNRKWPWPLAAVKGAGVCLVDLQKKSKTCSMKSFRRTCPFYSVLGFSGSTPVELKILIKKPIRKTNLEINSNIWIFFI